MLYWIARTCREARIAARRKQVHIGASADMDQSTINRFEKGIAWPRNPDLLVDAYAHDLDVPAHVLWRRALEAWGHAADSDTNDLAA